MKSIGSPQPGHPSDPHEEALRIAMSLRREVELLKLAAAEIAQDAFVDEPCMTGGKVFLSHTSRRR